MYVFNEICQKLLRYKTLCLHKQLLFPDVGANQYSKCVRLLNMY